MSILVDLRGLVRGAELLRRPGLLRHSGCQALLELAHGLAETARQLRELLGAEEEDPEGEPDPEILWSKHSVLLCPCLIPPLGRFWEGATMEPGTVAQFLSKNVKGFPKAPVMGGRAEPSNLSCEGRIEEAPPGSQP